MYSLWNFSEERKCCIVSDILLIPCSCVCVYAMQPPSDDGCWEAIFSRPQPVWNAKYTLSSAQRKKVLCTQSKIPNVREYYAVTFSPRSIASQLMLKRIFPVPRLSLKRELIDCHRSFRQWAWNSNRSYRFQYSEEPSQIELNFDFVTTLTFRISITATGSSAICCTVSKTGLAFFLAFVGRCENRYPYRMAAIKTASFIEYGSYFWNA